MSTPTKPPNTHVMDGPGNLPVIRIDQARTGLEINQKTGTLILVQLVLPDKTRITYGFPPSIAHDLCELMNQKLAFLLTHKSGEHTS